MTTRIRTNFVRGLVANNPLAVGGTTLSADGLADLPVVADGDIAVIVIDPAATYGDPEVVYVTAHTASATSATITRAREGSSAREHVSGTPWAHGMTPGDLLDMDADGNIVASVEAALEQVRTKSHPVYDVTHPDFGAVGNGTTDDLAAIQAAIDAATAAGGGEVFLPPGTYRVSDTVELKANVYLRGAGIETTVIQADSVAGPTEIVNAERDPGLTVSLGADVSVNDETIEVETDAGANFAAGQAVYLRATAGNLGGWTTYVQSVAGDVLTLTESSPIAIAVSDGGTLSRYSNGLLPGIAVSDLTLKHATPGTAEWDYGLALNGCDNPFVTRVKVENAGIANFRVVCGRDARLIDCVSGEVNSDITSGTGYEGFHTTAAMVRGCVSYASAFGVAFSGCPLSTIEEHQHSGNTATTDGRGIKLQYTSSFSAVLNCLIRDARKTGIQVADSPDCRVEGNAIFATGDAAAAEVGINVGEDAVDGPGTPSARCVVANNSVRHAKYPIVVAATTASDNTDCLVVGNRISDCTNAIRVGSSRNSVVANHVIGPRGVLVYAGANNAVIGNLLVSTGGLAVIDTTGATLSAVLNNLATGGPINVGSTDTFMGQDYEGDTGNHGTIFKTAGANRGYQWWFNGTRRYDLSLTGFIPVSDNARNLGGAGNRWASLFIGGAFTHSGATFGALGATPAAQRSHVADPTGGVTVDAEARTAINSILTTLETFGFHAAS